MSGTTDPGGTFDTALAIASRDLRRGVTLDQAISPATDDDYFSLALRKNQAVTITVNVEDPNDNWSFLAFGPDRNPLDYGISKAGTLYTITFNTPARGDYYFAVAGFEDVNADTPNGNYTISFG